MRIGERISIQPDTFGSDLKLEKDRGFCKMRKSYPGTVTYIHRSGRWYQVTFDNGIKECFFCNTEQGTQPRKVFQLNINRYMNQAR